MIFSSISLPKKYNALLTGNSKGHVFAAFLAKQVPL